MSGLYGRTLPADSPDRQRPPRMHLGRAPNPQQNPQLLARLVLPELWYVSALHARIGRPGKRLSSAQEASDEWLNLKVWAEGRALHKANYWTAYHPDQRRFTVRGDSKALHARQPLCGAVAAAMHVVSAALKDGDYATLPLMEVHAREGERFEVLQRPNPRQEAEADEQRRILALVPYLTSLQPGQTYFTMEPRPVVYWAVQRAMQAGVRLSGKESPLGGWDVTRLS